RLEGAAEPPRLPQRGARGDRPGEPRPFGHREGPPVLLRRRGVLDRQRRDDAEPQDQAPQAEGTLRRETGRIVQGVTQPMRVPGALWRLPGPAYLACEAAAAAAFPGYSYARDFISDLGVPYDVLADGGLMRSPLAGVMNLGGFVVDGILFGAAAILAARAAGR